MPYILPNGNYYESSNHVAEGSVECARRTTVDYVLADDWQDDPMNPVVCWRERTVPEKRAAKRTQADKFKDFRFLILSVVEEIYANSAELQAEHSTFADFRNAIAERVADKL